VETLLAHVDVFEKGSKAMLEVGIEEGDGGDLLLDHDNEQVRGGEELGGFVLGEGEAAYGDSRVARWEE
jgi:hypothetical protein